MIDEKGRDCTLADVIFPKERYDANGQKYILSVEDTLEELEMFRDAFFFVLNNAHDNERMIRVVNNYLLRKNKTAYGLDGYSNPDCAVCQNPMEWDKDSKVFFCKVLHRKKPVYCVEQGQWSDLDSNRQ